MTVTVRYIGTVNPYFELAVTGKPTKWTPGRSGDVSDGDAALLLATGVFEVYADKVLPFVFNSAGAIVGVRGATGAVATLPGGGSGASGYLGQVASQAAMLALTAAVGDECLRTDLGTGGLRYELTALPATAAGNWQPIQGTLADGSTVTVTLVDGKLPRTLAVDVASGCQVTVTIGGVTQPVLVENSTGAPTRIVIGEPPSAAQPTTLTIQRTSGSGTTSTWSLLDVSTLIEQGVVPTYAALIAAYPEKGDSLGALPVGTQVYVEDMQCAVRRSSNGKFWIPSSVVVAPKVKGTNAHWYGPPNITVATSAGQTRKIFRPYYQRMPGFRPATVSRYALYFHTPAGVAGAGSDSGQIRVYPANPDGSPMEGAAPLYVWDFNAGGTGGAAMLSLVSSTTVTRIEADIVGGPVDLPPHFYIGFVHDLATTAPTMGILSATGTPLDMYPGELSGTDLVDTANLNRSQGYSWTQGGAWTIGDTQVWPVGTELATGGSAVVGVHLKVTG